MRQCLTYNLQIYAIFYYLSFEYRILLMFLSLSDPFCMTNIFCVLNFTILAPFTYMNLLFNPRSVPHPRSGPPLECSLLMWRLSDTKLNSQGIMSRVAVKFCSVDSVLKVMWKRNHLFSDPPHGCPIQCFGVNLPLLTTSKPCFQREPGVAFKISHS